jgi:MoaA/NifB/PqqE/SkfB family radical SAM enzyme
MECAVITTYRCNAKCMMCKAWENPSKASEEITPEIIDKIPGGHTRLNITGGEPTLRKDLEDIVAVLDKKTNRLEISTNGYFTDRLVDIARKYPNIMIRVSVEGLPKLNDELRGLQDGFDHALRTVLRLKEVGLKDVGFGIVISDKNVADLLDLYHLMAAMNLEFSNATMHNSYYFFKDDNSIEDLELVTSEMKKFITALLTSKRSNLRMRVKDWFRAYINLGLLNHMQGKARPLKCGAATDTFFLDPYGFVLACNGSAEPWVMGDLKTADFDEIWEGDRAKAVRERVSTCDRGCWMTGTAVPAMRKKIWVPMYWVLGNKLRLALGKEPKLC